LLDGNVLEVDGTLHAREEDADLGVVGVHGRGEVARLIAV
jgi:nucleotide-binding universal stress UspA family protein